MSIDPGRTDGGRPRIGPTLKVTLSRADAARIERILHEARRRYERVPREFRSRSSLVRACVEGQLGVLEKRVMARPEPKDEGS